MKTKVNSFLKAINNNIYLDEYVNSIFLKNDPKWKSIVNPSKLAYYKKKYSSIFTLLYYLFIVFLPMIVFGKILFDFIRVIFLYVDIKQKEKDISMLKESKSLVLLSDVNVLHAIDKGEIIDFCIFTLPFNNFEINKNKYNCSISSLIMLNIFTILYSFFLSCISVFFVIIKYGYKNSLYAALSFEWFLYYFALCNLSDKNKQLYFSSQKDRWAILYDNLNFDYKTLVQHGTNIIKVLNSDTDYFFKLINHYNSYALLVPTKYNSINTLIAFTEEEAEHIIVGEFNVKPESIIYMGYNIKIDKYPRDNGMRKVVLLIGNVNSFYKQEQKIIDKLDFEKYNLLIKPHPLSRKDMYESIYENHTIVYNNPDAEIIIAYNSTLAYEYQSLGYRVYIYDTIADAENIVLMLNDSECF